MRPSDERFGSNVFATKGVFAPLGEGGYGGANVGCSWIVKMYQQKVLKNNEFDDDWCLLPKTFKVTDVIEGILAEQSVWNQNLGGEKVSRNEINE